MNFISRYDYLYMPQIVFLLLSCGSIFLMPFIAPGKCTGKKYLIGLIAFNAAEAAAVIYMFSGFQRDVPADLSNVYKGIAGSQMLYFTAFVCNNIITVQRCRTAGLKRYNYIIPGLQFIKIIGFITCVFIFIDKLEMKGFLPLGESVIIWIPLILFISVTNGIQIVCLRKDGGNDNKREFPAKDKVEKNLITGLIIVEIMFAVSAVITYGYYDRFWKINMYVFTWFWLDGLAGIILFVYGKCRAEKMIFKKDWLMLLAIPLLSSFLEFIGVVMRTVSPSYGAGLENLKAMCHIVGFPVMIIFSLQDRYKINKLLIGVMAVLTPLARLVVAFNIWAR